LAIWSAKLEAIWSDKLQAKLAAIWSDKLQAKLAAIWSPKLEAKPAVTWSAKLEAKLAAIWSDKLEAMLSAKLAALELNQLTAFRQTKLAVIWTAKLEAKLAAIWSAKLEAKLKAIWSAKLSAIELAKLLATQLAFRPAKVGSRETRIATVTSTRIANEGATAVVPASSTSEGATAAVPASSANEGATAAVLHPTFLEASFILVGPFQFKVASVAAASRAMTTSCEEEHSHNNSKNASMRDAPTVDPYCACSVSGSSTILARHSVPCSVGISAEWNGLAKFNRHEAKMSSMLSVTSSWLSPCFSEAHGGSNGQNYPASSVAKFNRHEAKMSSMLSVTSSWLSPCFYQA
jgi:hypothetical protein